jgi:hypothetical protein
VLVCPRTFATVERSAPESSRSPVKVRRRSWGAMPGPNRRATTWATVSVDSRRPMIGLARFRLGQGCEDRAGPVSAHVQPGLDCSPGARSQRYRAHIPALASDHERLAVGVEVVEHRRCGLVAAQSSADQERDKRGVTPGGDRVVPGELVEHLSYSGRRGRAPRDCFSSSRGSFSGLTAFSNGVARSWVRIPALRDSRTTARTESRMALRVDGEDHAERMPPSRASNASTGIDDQSADQTAAGWAMRESVAMTTRASRSSRSRAVFSDPRRTDSATVRWTVDGTTDRASS